MLQILHIIQYEMLATQFKTLVRGYITRGSVYHKHGLIFGPGYSDAFKGESLIGGAPRIVLDPMIVKDAKRVIESIENRRKLVTALDFLVEDPSDGFYFIDYLNPFGTSGSLSIDQLRQERESIKDFINNSLSKFEYDYKIKAKYKWLENYFNNTEKYYR